MAGHRSNLRTDSRLAFFFVITILNSLACGDDTESPRSETETDSGDALHASDSIDTLSEVDTGSDVAAFLDVGEFCSAPTLACGPIAQCVAERFNCGDYLGSCRLRPEVCEEPQTRWRACVCDSEYPSLCAARLSGRGDRGFLCESFDSSLVECSPDDGDVACPNDGVCIYALGPGGHRGQCRSLVDICPESSSLRVCAAHLDLPNNSPSDCWESPCSAWLSGYRGSMALVDPE